LRQAATISTTTAAVSATVTHGSTVKSAGGWFTMAKSVVAVWANSRDAATKAMAAAHNASATQRARRPGQRDAPTPSLAGRGRNRAATAAITVSRKVSRLNPITPA
jgi:hypothetical protein